MNTVPRQPYDGSSPPEQIPLLEAEVMRGYLPKPERLEIFQVWAWHGIDRRWKCFPDLWLRGEQGVRVPSGAEEFAEQLPGCWTHVRIVRVVIE